MIAEDRLIGWACMIRLAFDAGEKPFLPICVQDQLVTRGWMEIEYEPDWQGNKNASFTEAGWTITDLHAAEWGIDAMPESEPS